MVSNTEILEKQNAVIRMQADIIDSIFTLLAQYVNIEELECIDNMQKAAALYREIEL